jgi:hypothetical protein
MEKYKKNMTEKEAKDWLFDNLWSNPIMRMTSLGEAIYQDVKKEKELEKEVKKYGRK